MRGLGLSIRIIAMLGFTLFGVMPSMAAVETSLVSASQPGAPRFSIALRAELSADLSARGPEYEARTRHVSSSGRPIFTNRLLLEKSPYLQQHAHNPVNWFPWGPEAFAEARRLGRPVLVSIGYSTCHWCHVMEEESFDAIETARFLNAHFIAIKVDREARPDIDSIYMSAIHAMGERGGWPLNMFVTSEGKPFFGGTYFPPTDRGGRPSFLRVLRQISQAYADRNAEIAESAEILASRVKAQLEGHVGRQSMQLGSKQLEQALDHWGRAADRVWGGVGRGTKFPSSLPIALLLREARRTQSEDIKSLALLTLDQMAAGGIHDHLGGGFHRYATDERWLVPHFEKMLYDNALIARSYLAAFRMTGEDRYERVLRGLLDYVIREMRDSSGGFYSATDADSLTPEGESEEGYFFTWSKSEIKSLLGAEGARVPIAWFGVTLGGQLEGRNVLHTWRDADVVSSELGLSRSEFDRQLMAARQAMLTERAGRRAPLRDDKVLVSWNGLMISALAETGFALEEPGYLAAAEDCAEYVLASMLREGRLSRVSLSGEIGGPAFLEDYAFLIRGLIDLYEATGEPRWIEAALSLQQIQDTHYLDAVGGGYFRSAGDAEVLLAREKPIVDGAVPSGNSVAASNLSRLAALTGLHVYTERLGLLYSAFAGQLGRSPSSSAVLLETVSDREVGFLEIILVEPMLKAESDIQAEAANRTHEMLEPLREHFAPNRVVIRTREGEALESLGKTLSIVEGKSAIGGKLTAYVCEERVCQFPTTDPETFAKQLVAVRKVDAEAANKKP
ncbi:MAG: thioredoxin domain-containing protein [Myxococcales bacterium]